MRVLHDETNFGIGTLVDQPIQQGAFWWWWRWLYELHRLPVRSHFWGYLSWRRRVRKTCAGRCIEAALAAAACERKYHGQAGTECGPMQAPLMHE